MMACAGTSQTQTFHRQSQRELFTFLSMKFLIKGTAMNLPNIKGVFISMQWRIGRSAEEAEVLALNHYFRKELKALGKNYIEVYILEEVITV